MLTFVKPKVSQFFVRIRAALSRCERCTRRKGALGKGWEPIFFVGLLSGIRVSWSPAATQGSLGCAHRSWIVRTPSLIGTIKMSSPTQLSWDLTLHVCEGPSPGNKNENWKGHSKIAYLWKCIIFQRIPLTQRNGPETSISHIIKTSAN